MRVITSKGLKLIFRFRPEEWPEGIKTCNLWVGEEKHNEIELRANGSYSLGISSIHPDGTPYVLADGSEFNPLTLSKSEIEEIVRGISGEDVDNDERVYVPAGGEDLPIKIIPLETLGENAITIMAPKVRKYYSEGTKNYFTLAYFGNLRRLGVSYEYAYKLACIIDPTDTKNLMRVKYIYNYTGRLPGKNYLVKVFREQFRLDSLEIVNALQEILGPIEIQIAKQRQQEQHQQEERDKKRKKKLTGIRKNKIVSILLKPRNLMQIPYTI